MIKKLQLIIVFCSTLVLTTAVKAQQDGQPDYSFGIAGSGYVPLDGGVNDNLRSVFIQPDGKIVVGGSFMETSINRCYIARLLPDGSMDNSFNGSGRLSPEDPIISGFGPSIALAADGGIFYSYAKDGMNKWPFLGKLSSSGASVFSGASYFISNTSHTHNMTSMAYNRATDRVVLGGYAYYTFSYMLMSKHTGSGALETAFNSTGKLFLDNNFSPQMSLNGARAILSLDDGSTLLGGYSAPPLMGLSTYTVVKIKPNGTLDETFGANGISRQTIDSTYAYVAALLQAPDGKILVAGANASSPGIFRLNADGSLDNTFKANLTSFGSGVFNSIQLQPDNKILVSGTCTYSGVQYGTVARYFPEGHIDSSFGVGGVVSFPNMEFNASAISTSDRRLVLVGKRTTDSKMVVFKLKYGVQKYNIIGKDIVASETENSFMIHPREPGNSCSWYYSSSNIYMLGETFSDTITYYFNKNTPSGTLYCTVYSPLGETIAEITKEITVSSHPTLAQQLTPLACELSQTYADQSYINGFRLRQTNVGSANTGASLTGYSDLTASDKYDTLYVGNNYQAFLETSNQNGSQIYCGLWIDLDNDGKMESENEFLGSAASYGPDFTVNNISIPVNANPGPKRVRVRVRQSQPFQAYEFCMPNEEMSETEDYLIVLGHYQGIKTPNFITPNNDGKNDYFVVRGVREEVSNTLRIFDRAGELVYDVENYDNSWGGEDRNGGKLRPGTYYFVFTQSDASKAKDEIVKGFFEIRY